MGSALRQTDGMWRRGATASRSSRRIAAAYVSLIDELLTGSLSPKSFAWAYEQQWLAQPGQVEEPLFEALDALFHVVEAYNPQEAQQDERFSTDAGVVGAAREARERLAGFVARPSARHRRAAAAKARF